MRKQAKFFRADRAALAIFFLLISIRVSPCRADDFGDVSVTADAMYTGNTYHGYAAVRILLNNHSNQKTHVVSLNYPNDSFYRFGNEITRLSRTVNLSPDGSEVVTLLQPPLPISGVSAIGVDIDGGHVGEMHAPNANSHCQGYSPGTLATAFISTSLDFDGMRWMLNLEAPASASGTSSPGSAEGLRAEMPASQWSANWLAYTPFDIVAVRSSDLTSMPADAATALCGYVRAGGSLIVFGDGGVPGLWRAGIATPLADGNNYALGLGNCFVLKRETPGGANPDTAALLRQSMNSHSSYWQSLPHDIQSLNSNMELVDKDTLNIPARSIVGIMLLFVLLIGPVNILLLARQKRRTWLLWTIPAISLTTTLLVFSYSLLREGFTPTVRITGLTVLDQAGHRAETIGAEGFYCPLTPAGGLHFDYATEATPLISNDYGSGTSRQVDWTRGQQFTAGWVAARTPTFFHLRKSETRLERVRIEQKDGHLRIINGLGAPIQSLWYADADMKIYLAQNIAAGQTGEMLPAQVPPSPDPPGSNGLFNDIGFMARTDSLGDRVKRYLNANTYIAVLDANPFLENPLGSSYNQKFTKTSAVVFGILDAGDKP